MFSETNINCPGPVDDQSLCSSLAFDRCRVGLTFVLDGTVLAACSQSLGVLERTGRD